MKLLAVLPNADSSTGAQVDHTGTIPVDGAPPRPSLLVLDCPGLKHADRKSLLDWLARGGGVRVGHGRAIPEAAAGALDAVPAACWTVASLGQVVDLPNFDQLAYLVAYAAPLSEIRACLAERVPALLDRIEAALALGDVEQIARLTALRGEVQRVAMMVWSMNSRAERHVTDLAERVDREALAELRARGGFDVDAWVAAAAAMKADPGRIQALIELVQRIPEGPDATQHADAILDAVRSRDRLYAATKFAPAFWAALGPLLDFPGTEHHGEVDLSNATEAIAIANWDLVEARRIGRMKPGRKVLVVAGDGKRKSIYVRGTRALLAQVIAAGGRLRHHGVTLTYPTEQRPLTPLLMEVTRIDTLAYVDPPAALALLADRAPPPDHPVHALAARARTDPVRARVLADMLIELAAGIDADVARKLARGR